MISIVKDVIALGRGITFEWLEALEGRWEIVGRYKLIQC